MALSNKKLGRKREKRRNRDRFDPLRRNISRRPEALEDRASPTSMMLSMPGGVAAAGAAALLDDFWERLDERERLGEVARDRFETLPESAVSEEEQNSHSRWPDSLSSRFADSRFGSQASALEFAQMRAQALRERISSLFDTGALGGDGASALGFGGSELFAGIGSGSSGESDYRSPSSADGTGPARSSIGASRVLDPSVMGFRPSSSGVHLAGSGVVENPQGFSSSSHSVEPRSEFQAVHRHNRKSSGRD